jgi:hypothetical protein
MNTSEAFTLTLKSWKFRRSRCSTWRRPTQPALRGRLAVFFLQVFFQGTGVDADTDRNPAITGGIDHGTHTVFATDVARVDAQAVDAQFGHAQRDLVVEVDVGNQRHLDQLLDLAEGLGGVHVRHRNPHDVDAGCFQTIDLRNGGRDIIGVAVGHALHRDGRIAAHRHDRPRSCAIRDV